MRNLPKMSASWSRLRDFTESYKEKVRTQGFTQHWSGGDRGTENKQHQKKHMQLAANPGRVKSEHLKTIATAKTREIDA